MARWIDNWTKIAELFTTTLGSVQPSQWDAPTPCADWNLRQLVGHAVDYQRGYGVYLGAGEGIDAPLGDDVPGAWVQIRAALAEVYDRPATRDRSFDMLTPLIPGSVADQLIVPTHDLAMHTWDLSQAIGSDVVLPRDICAELLDALRSTEPVWRIPEWYGPATTPPAEADVQTQLVCFTGRTI